jgi:hypothetical protein
MEAAIEETAQEAAERGTVATDKYASTNFLLKTNSLTAGSGMVAHSYTLIRQPNADYAGRSISISCPLSHFSICSASSTAPILVGAIFNSCRCILSHTSS